MIKTKRLRLVPFDIGYAEDLYELWSDFEVVRYTYTPLMKSIDECAAMIRTQIDRTDKTFTDRFVILLNDKAIGMVGCVVMNTEKSLFGLYYQLKRRYWGNGYASECARAVIEYVFEGYPEATIIADAVSANNASLSVLKKVGFTEIHTTKNGFLRNGLALDLVDFTMSNPNKQPRANY
ncbi:MAG TPA: GNAT family N-acetyltransferase [Eubacteriales bacterium]|nr:GNAT family N-acetyltransferase [Clostridia bacterium]HRV73684.1 GNAT family N-acetyltransferase [Eubacteriales bacterium]